jgi:alpha-tubulin suppressor-like RCC1 family protein
LFIAHIHTYNKELMTRKFLHSTIVLILTAYSSLQGTAQKISSGSYHSIYLCESGYVNSWGSNITGQIGDNTTSDRYQPVYTNLLSNVVDVAGGGQYSFALTADGRLWGWGGNASGQLGTGDVLNRNEPTEITAISNVAALAPGTNYMLVLLEDGTVWGWGSNGYTLGNGTSDNSLIPVQVSNLDEVTQVSAGVGHALALRSDGTVWAWGSNNNGKLGDGTTTDRSTPVQVINLEDVIEIAAGKFHHSLALKNDGTVWAWGENTRGQLGDSSTVHSSVPVQVRDLTDVVSISAGYMHSLALKSDGTLWAWGSNEHGQIGNNENDDQISPVQVLTDVASLAHGFYYHTMVEKTDGSIWGWGINTRGVLGDGTTSTRRVPQEVGNLCLPIVSVNETTTDKPILYPNPASADLFLSGMLGNTFCGIYDISGRLMMQQQFHSASALEVETISIKELAPGIYLLITDNDGQRFQHTWVKQ